MFAVMGVTGQVGKAVANALLDAGKKVRVILRDAAKGSEWSDRGCEVSVTDNLNVPAMTKALTGVEGAFILMPPNYDPAPGFPDTVATNLSVRGALEKAKSSKVVVLSTVGAHVERANLLNNLKMSEESFRTLNLPITFLRAAWFMENSSWDLSDARHGTINGFLQPAEHPIPMVAVRDIGKAVAQLLQEEWSEMKVVELEGPSRYTAKDIEKALSIAFGHQVRTRAIPRSEWESLFRAQGANNPLPRIQMIDGFNEGWIDFEGNDAEHRKGSTTLNEAIAQLVADRA
ncbi:NmrA family transcriptional regulator [Pseudomonas simiae]|uniref:NmrA family NAD(P)-binding protein n=1 Tax=Pseudomonas simiae TaxID=321846 RepID=UPI000D03DC83|nr:NmrA family NAD(P)-binding protein [Pseudomonas simiae]PRW89838.1 NmrA family transcriptional regulator [Pseudomonas simiae]